MKYIILLVLCITVKLSSNAQLKINEVLYDPSSTGLEGDANGDGVYSQTQDEFIELVNTGSTDLYISKYRIFDKVKSTGLKTRRHTIGNFSIPSNGAIVIFGGDSLGFSGNFGGALVVIDSGTAGLSFANSGEIIIIEDSLGNVVDSLDTDALSNNPNESYTRNPDITGDFVQHGGVTPLKLFSPGRKVNGDAFNTVLSIPNRGFQNDLVLYPNPGTGIFQISNTRFEGKEVQISDPSGNQVSRQKITEGRLDLNSLSLGIYFVKGVDFEFRSKVIITK